MKLNKQIFLVIFSVLVMSLNSPLFCSQKGQFRLPSARFYYVTTADLQGSPVEEIIAAGQIQQKKKGPHQALIVLLQQGQQGARTLGQLTFPLYFRGKTIAARIRAIQVYQDPVSRQWHLVSAGRGGTDEEGVGFLHQAVIRSGQLHTRDIQIFHARGGQYTHGYPLAVADLDGDRIPEMVYGGFSGEKKGDVADVRTFKLAGGKFKQSRQLFKALPVPLRVNALSIADITGDQKPEIVIAGRVKKENGKEYSAFAWTSGDQVNYHVFKESHPCRLRTILITDIDNDQKNELITGGRIDSGPLWLADLRVWKIKANRAVQLARFNWGLGNQIRLRTLAPVKDQPQRLWVGGRAERQFSGKKQWQGFIWQFSMENNFIRPIQITPYLDLGSETRVRHLHLTNTGKLIGCGFGKGKPDYGFVILY